MLFTVIRHDRPNSLSLRLSARPAHLKYLQTVLERIVYGGALLDEEGNQIGSMLLIDVVDGMAAHAFADNDPFDAVGLFATTSVEPFRPVFKDGAWLK